MNNQDVFDFLSWKIFLEEKLTDDIIKTGFKCIEIPECFKLGKITPENNIDCQYSVMYTPCDVRELAICCGEEQSKYVSKLLRILFERLLVIVGIDGILLKKRSNSIDIENKKRQRDEKFEKDIDCYFDDNEWYKCSTVSVNSHSLPLSTPINWLSCEDIEHVLSSPKYPYYFQDMFYVCVPIRLKHACVHEDKRRSSLNVGTQKEMVILLTDKFAELCNFIKKSEYCGEKNNLKLIETRDWNCFYPSNSFRVGLFMTMKVSTIHLHKFNPLIFTNPIFINPFYNINCSSCYYSWIRLIKDEDNYKDVDEVLNYEEMQIITLETKGRIFLNGSSTCENEKVKVHRVIKSFKDRISIDNQSPFYVGEAYWPGRTSKGVLNPKFLIGLINTNMIVLGAKEIDSSEVEIKDNDQWTQGGEIIFPVKEKNLKLIEKPLNQYILEHLGVKNTENSNIEDYFIDDITTGNTKLIKSCSKYTVVPYFGPRNVLKINDSLIHDNSALGISKNRQYPTQDISIHLLSCICSYLPLKDFSVFRSVCRTHCCRTIFNSYVQNLTLFEGDLYLPILGQLYPFLSKAKSITVIQSFKTDPLLTDSIIDQRLLPIINYYSSRVPPIVIQSLAAYTPKARKMSFSHHSNANLAKIISRASGRKPETVVLSPTLNLFCQNFNFEETEDLDLNHHYSNNLSIQTDGESRAYNNNQQSEESSGSIITINQDHIEVQPNMPIVPQTSPVNTPNLQPFHENDFTPIPNLIEIHIIGNIESTNTLPTSLFRIPITAPFRKLIRYFRDVVSIHEGIIDLYILRYGIKDRLIPDLSPIDYGIIKGPTVLFAIGSKTLQYSQKIWISLFLVGSKHFPYLPKLRFNASMSTPFSRLAESYSRNVNISVSDVLFIYKDAEIDLDLSPYDYNVSENDTIEVILRTRITSNDAINSS